MMASREQRETRVLRRMTLVCVAVGLFSTLSYGLGASIALRFAHPALGAWWDAHQFYFMAGAATALGLLLGIRIGRRLVADEQQRSRSLILALVLAIISFLPLMHVGAAAARLGWSGSDGPTWSRIVDRVGYGAAKPIDKVLIAGLYFTKIAGFALIGGLALIALAVAASLLGGGARSKSAAQSTTA
jgi:hypothetical protein